MSTLIFNAKHCRSQTPGTTLFSTTSDRDGSPRLPTKRSSRAVTRRGTANHLWFVHDAAPAHFLPAVRQFSNNLFPQQRTVRCGPTARPAHQRGTIHSLPFMLQHSASPGLVTAEPISAGAAMTWQRFRQRPAIKNLPERSVLPRCHTVWRHTSYLWFHVH